jgi:hypothetical protein
MTPINCSYIYNIGQTIERLGAIKAENSFSDVAQPLLRAYGTLQEIRDQQVYALPLSKAQARNLLNVLDNLWEKYETRKEDQLGQDEVGQLFQARTNFETVLKAEWDKEAVFAVSVKRGFDSNALVWDGLRLFPQKLANLVPEAVTDFQAATRCIAFELPTAAAFHLCRGFEAVVRKLVEAKCGQLPDRPSEKTLGALFSKLERLDLESKLLASLRDLKDLHRNPSMHPEHTLESVDEAIALLNAMDAPISHMLRVISDSTQADEHTES